MKKESSEELVVKVGKEEYQLVANEEELLVVRHVLLSLSMKKRNLNSDNIFTL